MKYVALLSGGKDSCFNLLHCQHNGHELVAGATLGPAEGTEELDSYMYQTVGQDAIQLVADALEIPLYRRTIMGTAIQQDAEYGNRDSTEGVQGDETEDLYELLSTVKSHHPDIQGVSVGAILSNYQRVRVEHVCRRLSLTCLSYLWQRSQEELLAEMIAAGMESILIKVAGIGLEIKHLGKTLAEMQGTLLRLNNLYGAHVCGEGGEYETLTLDCPLFKSRIVLQETKTVIHSDNDFATVAFLKVKQAYLAPKAASEISFALPTPSLLDEIPQEIFQIVEASQQTPTQEVTPFVVPPDLAASFVPSSCKRTASWVTSTNVQADYSINEETMAFSDEVRLCFEMLRGHLAQHGLNLEHITNINMFLSSMDLFLEANAIYSQFFGTSPPSRAGVAVDLPPPNRIRLECIASIHQDDSDRQALHVQGLSYWAPANIGPYSQAVKVHEHVFVSGQIGLIPSSLSLPNPKLLATETALSVQHIDRVVSLLQSGAGGGWEGFQQVAIYWLTGVADIKHVSSAHRTYEEATLPVPSLFVVVKDLPKGALVEKQVMLHTGRFVTKDEQGEGEVTQCRPKYTKSISNNNTLAWQTSNFSEGSSSCTILFGKRSALTPGHIVSTLQRSNVLVVRVFYDITKCPEPVEMLEEYLSTVPITVVPCRAVSDADNNQWDCALCILTT